MLILKRRSFHIALGIVFMAFPLSLTITVSADLIECATNPDNVLCKALAREATGLPEGCHIATPDEVAVDEDLAGRPVCPGDTAAGITGNAGAAKAYLNSLPKKPLSNCAPPNKENIERLNNKFAICAANFFRAYTQRYGDVVITSAFRDGRPGTAGDGSGRSANACAGGASGSNHMGGLALDVYPASRNFEQMWNFARANPQLGVCFPYLSGDRPHMAAAGFNTGEAASCARQGVRPCEGGGIVDPIRDAITTSPSSGITNALRGYLNPQASQQMCTLSDGRQVPCSSIANLGGAPQQTLPAASQPQFQQPPPISVQNTTPYAAGTCAPQFYCSGNTYYYRSSSCVDQVYQNCPAGCSASGGGCVVSGTTTSGGGLSVFDQITLPANPTPTVANGAATTTGFLIIGKENAATLQLNPPSQSVLVTPQTVYNLAPPAAQQTFTSGDLRDNVYSSPPQQLTTLQTTLATMK